MVNRDEKREALEQWLRRVPDEPGGLLRRKIPARDQTKAARWQLRTPAGRKSMVTLRAAIALLLNTYPCVHAELSVRLSSDSIEELKSVRLVIRAHDTRRAEALGI